MRYLIGFQLDSAFYFVATAVSNVEHLRFLRAKLSDGNDGACSVVSSKPSQHKGASSIVTIQKT